MKHLQRLTLASLALANLTGCNMTRATERPPSPMAVVRPQPVEILNAKKGSIWQSTDRNTLFLDNKARNVGDLVTVLVTENATAQRTASTDLSRDDQDQMGVGITSPFFAGSTIADSANITGKHAFKGSGSTARNGTLTTTISCVVIEVLANGNLRIEGRRDITVNHENQFVILSGVIRPEDISPANAVASAQVADARIDYSGDGDINDQQKPGWLNQFLSAIKIL